MLDPRQTVASAVLDHSECAQVFQRHRIDYCCRGELSIEAAAKSRQLDVLALVNELSSAIAERHGAPARDPRDLATPELIAHIVSKHHAYLRRALPFVVALASKVNRVHGERNPKLRELQAVVDALAAALLPHLDEEEQVLFPALSTQSPDRVAIARQLAAMLQEHLAVAQLLERARAAGDEFVVPDWGCNSYRTLFAELEQLESDVFTHVHLENHVLQPRFAAM